MITSVFFDLDDTLLDFKKGEAAAIRKALSRLGIQPTEAVIARYSAINQSQWELLEQGKITREQVLLRRFEILFGELGIQGSSREAQDIYEKLLGQEHEFLPGAQALLETLYGTYDLYLVSNGTASVQDSRLQATGIGRYFKQIFISERVGYDKPSPAFFDCCFAAIPGLDRRRVLMVGDSLTSDMRGGINAGLQTCWFNPHGKPRNPEIPVDYEISALEELPALLKRL